MQKEEEETNETNRRKRIRNESPDYLIQSSHCLCWSGQGGKPISVFFLVLFRLQMPWQISHPLPCLRPCSNPNHDNVWRKHVLRRVRAASRRITHFGAGWLQKSTSASSGSFAGCLLHKTLQCEDFDLQNGYIDTSGLLQATSHTGLLVFIQHCIIYNIIFRRDIIWDMSSLLNSLTFSSLSPRLSHLENIDFSPSFFPPEL